MYTYDKPLLLSYHFAGVDFGAGDTQVIPVPLLPNGRKPGGRVMGAAITNVSEAFTAVTTPASIRVGDGSDADKYFQSGSIGTTGAGEAIALEGALADIENGRDDVTVTFVSPTGGTPAGIGDVMLYIGWF